MNNKSNLLFGVLLACASIALVAIYFFIEGSPNKKMQLRMDQQRLQHLTEMVGHVHKLHGRTVSGTALEDESDLESMLESLERRAFRDPETDEKYEIHQISETEYEICMAFSLSYRDIDWSNGNEPDEKLKFEPGRNCFRFRRNENLGWGLFRYRYN